MRAPLKRVCTVSRIRELEREIFATDDSFSVMRRAADHVANACAHLPDPLILAAGSGNNGGDAIVTASILRAKGRDARLWLPLGNPKTGSDADKALKMWCAAKNKLETIGCNLEKAGAVVDGLFGIGLDRDLSGKAAKVVAQINKAGKPVLAIDVPSGVCSDSGAVLGSAVRADSTVTIFARKPGLLMEHGRDLAGDVQVATLGYELAFNDRDGCLCEGGNGLGPLARSSAKHKGSFGSLAVIGGADGMLGALVLASRAAVAHGAGKVVAVSLGEGINVDVNCPEVMWRKRPTSGHTALATGVGLGTDDNAVAAVSATLESSKPAVLDADALNLIAQNPAFRRKLKKRKSSTVLTPHPAEAARLLGCTTKEVQADRVGNASKLARKLNSVILLKGAGSVIAAADGGWQIVASGNSALAQAGSGDVLTGIVGALLAQQMDALDAAATGAWAHGAGAELAVAEHGGKLGVPLAEISRCSARILSWQVAATTS